MERSRPDEGNPRAEVDVAAPVEADRAVEIAREGPARRSAAADRGAIRAPDLVDDPSENAEPPVPDRAVGEHGSRVCVAPSVDASVIR